MYNVTERLNQEWCCVWQGYTNAITLQHFACLHLWKKVFVGSVVLCLCACGKFVRKKRPLFKRPWPLFFSDLLHVNPFQVIFAVFGPVVSLTDVVCMT